MIIKDQNKEYDVYLEDDCTMDTVISVNGKEFRYDCEFAADYRNDFGQMESDGFYKLAHDAIDAYETELTELNA